ncbi:MAG: flagellar motor switch protein FliN [Gammaproteobacteria bacterium]|nr:MAG: flagellar motor switch protein FliN [Gammaproteobacteria bacterium]
MTDEQQNDDAADLEGWGDAMEEQQAAEAQESAQTAQFDSLETSGDGIAERSGENLDTILDIPVTVSMELGRTKMTISNLLRLNQGSVVELERLAGEPLDMLVNGCLVAHGEVVVVNDRFGVRLTDILSPKERVKTLA